MLSGLRKKLPRAASSQLWALSSPLWGLGLPREEDPQTLSLDYRSFLDLAFLGENGVSVRFLERVGEYKLPQVSKLSPLPPCHCSGTQRYASRDKHISCPHPQHFCSRYPAPQYLGLLFSGLLYVSLKKYYPLWTLGSFDFCHTCQGIINQISQPLMRDKLSRGSCWMWILIPWSGEGPRQSAFLMSSQMVLQTHGPHLSSEGNSFSLPENSGKGWGAGAVWTLEGLFRHPLSLPHDSPRVLTRNNDKNVE